MNLSMSRFNSNRGLLAEILDLEKVLPGMLPRVSDIPRIDRLRARDRSAPCGHAAARKHAIAPASL